MNDCIFCKIINGDIPSVKVYEDEDVLALFDKFPSTPGHILVIPKKHVETIFDIDEKLAGKLFSVATKISKLMKEKLGVKELNVIQKNGKNAGQVIDHVHVHLIPRYENDDVTLSWKTKEMTDGDLKKLQQDIDS